MSTKGGGSVGKSAAADECCASCGIAVLDNIKLKECACNLVKYCSIECREEHREQHAEECKKRVEELHDQLLFTQPDSSCHGECPICFLPMPIDPQEFKKSTVVYSCCSILICRGCDYANDKSSGGDSCPFCREPTPKDSEEYNKRRMKRIEAGDPAALNQMGMECSVHGDHDAAAEYWMMAAELGDLNAHYHLGISYVNGWGVEKDEEKEVYHWEVAAIGGHPIARFNLGCYEWRNGRMERSVKHWMMSAKLGETESMKSPWKHYKRGNIGKDDLEATLRTHQAAIDAMKSPQREAADAAYGG